MGGVATMVRTLASALARHGIAVQELNVRNSSLQELRLAARRCDGIIASNNFLPAYMGAVLRALWHRPLIVWVHGPLTQVLEHGGASRVKKALLHLAYRPVDRFVFVSETVKQSFLAFANRYVSAQEGAVIHNAVPTPGVEVRTPTQTEHVRLVYVGRLSSEKNPLLLIAALRLLPPSFMLTMVGAGPLEQNIRTAASDLLASGRLRMVGQQPWTSTMYREFDLTVLSSCYEGCPMVTLESLSVGVPCVGVPIPALRELLGENAPYLLAADHSAQALAQTLLAVAAMPREKVQTDLVRVSEKFSLSTFSRQWLELLAAC